VNWAVAAGILTTFITSAASVVIAWINRGKIAEVHGQNREQLAAVAEVHVLVNSQRATLVNRVEQLKGSLAAAGVPVPPPPPPPPPPDGG